MTKRREPLEMRRLPRRSGEGAGGALRVVFFVLGSLLNLLALALLLGNVVTLGQRWLQGSGVALEASLLAPLGAFLAGVICYLIAFTFD